MARGRGGRRVPANPAPASGPGAASQRTDGKGVAALTSEQPVHGTNQQLEATAMRPADAPGVPTSGGAGQQAREPEDVFAPTRSPREPITAGIDRGAGPGPNRPVLPDDPNQFIRALARQFPHPDLDRLVARNARG